MALNAFFINDEFGASLPTFLCRGFRFQIRHLQNRLTLRLLVRELAILYKLRRHECQDLQALLFRQNTFPGRHRRTRQAVSDSFKQIILTSNGFSSIEQRQFTACRVANLERSLVEVAGSWPEAIGSWSITGSVNAMTPDTLGEIDPLAGLDHISGRFGSQFALLKSCRQCFFCKAYRSSASRNQNDSEG